MQIFILLMYKNFFVSFYSFPNGRMLKEEITGKYVNKFAITEKPVIGIGF